MSPPNTHTYTLTSPHTHIHIHTIHIHNTHTYIHTCIHILTSTHIYTHTHTPHIYTLTYIHIHIYTHLFRFFSHGVTDRFQKGKGVCQSPCLSNLYTEYSHLAYLTYIQSTSLKPPGWMKHKLESRLLGKYQ